ncbi:hypothetical protein COCC4DRAFT_67427 [Bipolaris maydis ATCC 48331]|nr:uncharacterized protein COCC4DRAFT_67427 [Bipolaris maydis ATCC 48331]KAJ5030300.1 hypothetical protein J3E73DRAFT_275930 [Bipolaris maydis]ENI10406.1 hypothetical protein COCC4DRAFT_67427 [Bipolaris maydis ATCC 48331]KAJ5065306.1 hypothetical protein J3E74DRAFT_461872 [Bipolaris maydis]KAJ6200520.1 hypothetical protein J3E72DRAFT_297512 [Bipolaris maydis]KAJ6213644.1 hypothetical protein PSV09DRAFT_2278352 [Bipolaris maydis]
MSSPPSTKRSLKPSPMTTNIPPTARPAPPADLPTLHPAASLTAPAQDTHLGPQQPLPSPTSRKRKSVTLGHSHEPMAGATESSVEAHATSAALPPLAQPDTVQEPKAKKSRTNTPWTPAEELRLKQMRDAGNSWSEIAKTFPQRTEGSVKKHWYKDMHYAEFAEDESAALLAAIKEYDANKWKVIGQKVGKPAKACEQYAKENFGGKY